MIPALALQVDTSTEASLGITVEQQHIDVSSHYYANKHSCNAYDVIKSLVYMYVFINLQSCDMIVKKNANVW